MPSQTFLTAQQDRPHFELWRGELIAFVQSGRVQFYSSYVASAASQEHLIGHFVKQDAGPGSPLI